jgi:hypothetical protein
MGDQIDEASSIDVEDENGPAQESARPIFPILALVILLVLAAILIYRLFF